MRTKLENLPPTMRAEAASLLPGLNPTLEERVEVERKVTARTNARNDGREFQREIETTCGAYQSRRVATLRKVDPPVRVIWIDDKEHPGKKRQHVIFMQNPHLDYVGAWEACNGRAIMIEAKSTATHRLPFNGDNKMKSHQVANAKVWAAAGAAVALVWKWADRVCLWTAPMLASAERQGAKSLVWEMGMPVPRGEGTVVWDFLRVLRQTLDKPENGSTDRPELVYLGHVLYRSPAGWWSDGLTGFPVQTIEKALELVEAQKSQCPT